MTALTKIRVMVRRMVRRTIGALRGTGKKDEPAEAEDDDRRRYGGC